MNHDYIIGADEVGYGALAGPLVVGGVKAKKDWTIVGLNDSKKLTDKQRRVMSTKIYEAAKTDGIEYHIACRSNADIDQFGVSRVLRDCYKEIAQKLFTPDSLIIVDGNINFDKEFSGMRYESLIKADTFIPTVMAASIIAKVYRDDIMIGFSKDCPHYGWEGNKGYGSKTHIEAIKKHGQSSYHRKSYKLKDI